MDTPKAKEWLKDYFELYRKALLEVDVSEKLIQLKELFQKTHQAGKKIVFVGNGGSAAMASHCAVDFTKNAGIRCINFNEADLITCFANDFGYERVFEQAIEHYADAGDVIVLVSSSGKSPNILCAAKRAKEKKYTLVTFSGFATDNPLYALGEINFCVNSRAYNIIEMTHHIWLLAVCDLIIGKAEYPASPQ